MAYSACHGCKERHVGCHGNCERYLAEKREAEKLKEEITKKRNKAAEIDGFRKYAMERVRKKRR